MKKIGLTGNAGSGKSTIRGFFEEVGVPSLDADLVAHEIYKRRPDVVAKLQSVFGEDVVIEGEVHRPTLAERAFASPEKTQLLNSIVHPVVGEEIQSWWSEVESQGTDVAVVEATLLLESGRQDWYDEIWVIGVDPEVQHQRLLERGWTTEQIESRLSKQWPQAKKAQMAQVFIDNSHDKMSLQTEFHKNFR